MTPLGNVPTDQPFDLVRGSWGFSLIFSLVNGPQPTLPTDPTYPPTNLGVSGTYLLFMVKEFDYDPDTGLPVPDNQALLTKDSRQGTIIIRNPPSAGLVEVPILATDTTAVNTYGRPLMPNGKCLRWSLKAFLSGGILVVAEHTPLAGPWTVWDRTVQVT